MADYETKTQNAYLSISGNPMPKLKDFLNGSKEEEPEPDPFTEDELRRIEATMLRKYSQYYPLILTRARTGMSQLILIEMGGY